MMLILGPGTLIILGGAGTLSVRSLIEPRNVEFLRGRLFSIRTRFLRYTLRNCVPQIMDLSW